MLEQECEERTLGLDIRYKCVLVMKFYIERILYTEYYMTNCLINIPLWYIFDTIFKLYSERLIVESKLMQFDMPAMGTW